MSPDPRSRQKITPLAPSGSGQLGGVSGQPSRAPVGDDVGDMVAGVNDGASVGISVGDPLGDWVGDAVSRRVGISLGAKVGGTLGIPVGRGEGAMVGAAVGHGPQVPISKPSCTNSSCYGGHSVSTFSTRIQFHFKDNRIRRTGKHISTCPSDPTRHIKIFSSFSPQGIWGLHPIRGSTVGASVLITGLTEGATVGLPAGVAVGSL